MSEPASAPSAVHDAGVAPPGPGFRRILCVADPGGESDAVLARAVELAERHAAELTVLDIVEPPPPDLVEVDGRWSEQEVRARRARRLEAAIAPYRARASMRLLDAIGTPFLVTVREVLRGGHDLVVKRCEDPDWLERTFGSDDLQLLRTCPCPVWVMDPKGPTTCRRVLAAVDVDVRHPAGELATRHGLARRTLDLACSIAIAASAELHVAYASPAMPGTLAWPGMPARLLLDYSRNTRIDHEVRLAALLRETADAIGRDAMARIERSEHVIEGNPRRVIPALVGGLGADLVVMGSVARTGVPGFVTGNTAELILEQLDCSVLVVKPPGFVTPVTVDAGPARR